MLYVSDINECEEYKNICDLDCVNTIGSYQCPKRFHSEEMGICLGELNSTIHLLYSAHVNMNKFRTFELLIKYFYWQ